MDMQFEGAGIHSHLSAGLEISQAELKKQIDHARRFGNQEIKDYARANSVKEALKQLQPEQLLQVLQSTRKAMGGISGAGRGEQQDIPQLKRPESAASRASMLKSGSDVRRITANSSEDELTSSARLTELLGRISKLAQQGSLQTLQSQLSAFNAMFNGAVTEFDDLAKALKAQGEQYASCQDALTAAQKQAQGLNHDVSAAQALLSKKQDKLTDLEAQAAMQNPVPPELQQQIDAARLTVDVAQGNLNTAQTKYDRFVAGSLAKAETALTEAKNALQAIQGQAGQVLSRFSPQQQGAIEAKRKQQDTDCDTLTFLMALMSQLINKNASEDLNAAANLKQKLAEAAEKDAQNKAKEYDEQVRKAEEMQQTMGCIGKTLGWAITAIGFAAAAFTGGASLALAAVGLALTASDEIYHAATGNSFMQEAMKPLMENVIQPMMEFFSKILTQALESLGVEKSAAEMAGQIMGAIAAAAAMVVAMMLASSAFSKVAGMVMQKIGTQVAKETSKTMAKTVAAEVEKEVAEQLVRNVVKEVVQEVAEETAKKSAQTTVQRLMESSVGQIFKRVSQGFGRSLGTSEVKMAKIANRADMALTSASMANTTTQAASSIYTASLMVDAAKVRAHMMNDIALQDLLNEMMDRVIETFAHRMASINTIVKNISNVAENQMQAGKYITQQMSSIAG